MVELGIKDTDFIFLKERAEIEWSSSSIKQIVTMYDVKIGHR